MANKTPLAMRFHLSRNALCEALKFKFPWLGTDEPVDGADVVDTLNDWYDSLEQPDIRQPRAEFSDTKEHFKWRIHYGEEVSPWYSYYEGMLVHTFTDGRTFALGTAYWDGLFPVEQPFEILTDEAKTILNKVMP